MSFSERYGFKKPRNLIQLDSMDDPLRNALWSVLKWTVWDKVQYSSGGYGGYGGGGGHYLSGFGNEHIKTLCEQLWFSYFKKPIDTLSNSWSEVHDILRQYFFAAKWNEVYDFIEFVAKNFEETGFPENFISGCNFVLEREMSAYRFADGVITRVTDKHEIAEIENALDQSRGPVKIHVYRALELLSDRKKPDYRNSIKESISAVESLVALVLNNDKGTLGQLLKLLEEKIDLHPALKTGFSSLYGYTSNEGGIRHALLEAEKITFEDAKFFLVACSAFINFVEVRALP